MACESLHHGKTDATGLFAAFDGRKVLEIELNFKVARAIHIISPTCTLRDSARHRA